MKEVHKTGKIPIHCSRPVRGLSLLWYTGNKMVHKVIAALWPTIWHTIFILSLRLFHTLIIINHTCQNEVEIDMSEKITYTQKDSMLKV